ncbi:MAG: hypothetical protein LDL07_14510 [Desulfarculus sp.]|nr:hypothetical protein [Desulfarculus sp.]
MIDIHCHILPKMDDGAKSWEETLEMCRVAARDGITDIIATPRFGKAFFQHSLDDIRKTVRLLNSHLDSQRIPVQVHPGADVFLEPATLEAARQGLLPTLADQGRYFLMEPPDADRDHGLDQMIFEFQSLGLTPIIAHPECVSPGKDWDWLEGLLEMGCLCQIRAASLTGDSGRQTRNNATNLLKRGLVHFVASEANSPVNRPPVLSLAREELLDLVGREATLRMLKTGPRDLLAGRSLDYPAPSSQGRKRRFGLGG